jgi:hypothetical protein
VNSTWIADATALKHLDRCEQYFVYRHREGLVSPAEESKPALVQGRAVHEWLARWWQGMLTLSDEAWRLAIEGLPWIHRYNYARLPYREGARILSVEQPMVDEASGYGGVVDLVYEKDSTVYVVDHKTTSGALSPAWVQQWLLSEQLAGYLDLIEPTLPPGTPIVAVIDAIRIPKPLKSGAQPAPEFGWYEFPFRRGLRQELASIRNRKVSQAQLLMTSVGNGAIKNTSSCLMFNQPCPYFALCSAPPEQREDVRERLEGAGELVVQRWDFQHRDEPAAASVEALALVKRDDDALDPQDLIAIHAMSKTGA